MNNSLENNMLTLRYYHNYLSDKEYLPVSKLLSLHNVLRIYRAHIRKYFYKLLNKNSVLESSHHVGIIKSYNLKSGTGVIGCNKTEFIFLLEDLNNQYFQNFAKINTVVFFWTNYHHAHSICPINRKFNKIMTGIISKKTDRLTFNLNGEKHNISILKKSKKLIKNNKKVQFNIVSNKNNFLCKIIR